MIIKKDEMYELNMRGAVEPDKRGLREKNWNAAVEPSQKKMAGDL